MPRIRTIKPEIWMSPQVMNLSHGARLLFLGLITQADDDGRGIADPRKLKAAIFGGDDITSTNVRRMLDEITGQRLAVLYDDATHGMLYELPSWKSHQSIDRPRKSAYPSSKACSEPSDIRRTLDEPDTKPREGSDRTGPDLTGREGNVAHARETSPQPAEAQTGNGSSRAGDDAAEHAEWERAQALYPNGAARTDWIGAEHAARNLVASGEATWDEIRAGITRYAAHCTATNRLVLNPVKFFTDRDRPWSQAWPIPTAANKPAPRIRTATDIAEEYEAKARAAGGSA